MRDEDPDQTRLSDGRIAELLSRPAVLPVARRTVAKYREALGSRDLRNERRRGTTRHQRIFS